MYFYVVCKSATNWQNPPDPLRSLREAIIAAVEIDFHHVIRRLAKMAEETKDTEVKGNEEFGTAPVPEVSRTRRSTI